MTYVLEPSSGSGLPHALGAYQLLERVGCGGLGECYRARDTVHGRTVMIKRIPSSVVGNATRSSAFVQATSRLAAVSHPGVAALYECGLSDGGMFLALEFVQGQRLDEIIGGRPLHPRRAVEIALELTDALTALHAAGIAHGDVRPANVVINAKGHAKLIDSGLAAFTDAGALRSSAGARLGGLPADSVAILEYLSPEEALGEKTDTRADLFSLGCVLYEMLTGKAPFDRPTPDATVLAVLRSQPPAPSASMATIPAELDLIATRALAKSLERRYPTAEALAEDLRVAKSVLDADVEERSVLGEEVAAPRSRRLAIMIGVLLVVGVMAWWFLAR
jgi:serine/threonine protein kinase